MWEPLVVADRKKGISRIGHMQFLITALIILWIRVPISEITAEGGNRGAIGLHLWVEWGRM